MLKRALVGAMLALCAASGCSTSHTDMAQGTCKALWNYLNANVLPAQYLRQIGFDSHYDSGDLATDALALSTASTTDQQNADVQDVERDCDTAGHAYNWKAAPNS